MKFMNSKKGATIGKRSIIIFIKRMSATNILSMS